MSTNIPNSPTKNRHPRLYRVVMKVKKLIDEGNTDPTTWEEPSLFEELKEEVSQLCPSPSTRNRIRKFRTTSKNLESVITLACQNRNVRLLQTKAIPRDASFRTKLNQLYLRLRTQLKFHEPWRRFNLANTIWHVLHWRQDQFFGWSNCVKELKLAVMLYFWEDLPEVEAFTKIKQITDYLGYRLGISFKKKCPRKKRRKINKEEIKSTKNNQQKKRFDQMEQLLHALIEDCWNKLKLDDIAGDADDAVDESIVKAALEQTAAIRAESAIFLIRSLPEELKKERTRIQAMWKDKSIPADLFPPEDACNAFYRYNSTKSKEEKEGILASTKLMKIYSVQYRGIHYTPAKWCLQGAENYIKAPDEIAAYGETSLVLDENRDVYSGTLDFSDPDIGTNAHDSKNMMNGFRDTSFVIATPGWGNDGKRFLYNTKADFVHEQYTNDMEGFESIIRGVLTETQIHHLTTDSPSKQAPDQKSQTTLKNPMVSFSNQPKHATRYAFGQKPMIVTSKPMWYPDGRVQNATVGSVIVMIAPVIKTIEEEPFDVCSKANRGEIIVKRFIAPEKEVSYHGKAPTGDETHYKRFTARYPSFDKEWTPELGKMLYSNYGINKPIYQFLKLMIKWSKTTTKIDDPVGVFLTEYISSFLCAKAHHYSQWWIRSQQGYMAFVGEILTVGGGQTVQENGTNEVPQLTRSASLRSQQDPGWELKFHLLKTAPYYLGSGNTGARAGEKDAMDDQRAIRKRIAEQATEDCPLERKITPLGADSVMACLDDALGPIAAVDREDAKNRFIATTNM